MDGMFLLTQKLPSRCNYSRTNVYNGTILYSQAYIAHCIIQLRHFYFLSFQSFSEIGCWNIIQPYMVWDNFSLTPWPHEDCSLRQYNNNSILIYTMYSCPKIWNIIRSLSFERMWTTCDIKWHDMMMILLRIITAGLNAEVMASPEFWE